MSSSELAINYVLHNEGGLEENPSDPGGITNYGISLRFLQNLKPEGLKVYGIFETPNADTVRHLTIDQAKKIYFGEFWEKEKFADIPDDDIASYIFDAAVNMGFKTAFKILQRGLWAFFYRDYIVDDGELGETTLEYLNKINSFQYKELLEVLCAERAGEYRLKAALNPNLKDNLDGWLNRAYREIIK